jgi:predicted metal-dependent hydrolase
VDQGSAKGDYDGEGIAGFCRQTTVHSRQHTSLNLKTFFQWKKVVEKISKKKPISSADWLFFMG